MRVAAGIIGLVLFALMLAEFFVAFLLPRRVKRDPRIARSVFRILWRPWRAVAIRLPRGPSDTMLGIFGPLGLLTILGLLCLGVILAFAGMLWSDSTHLGGGPGHPASAAGDLYFSAGAFFSASTPSAPSDGLGKAMQVTEAATGFAFLAIAIGYLPALFQAFSRRETAVSRLDPRAGSPPTAGALLERSGRRGGWAELDEYLREWESWTAELMETHLSYPILGFFRSQHLNQNWVAALTAVVDSCAYAMAYGPTDAVRAAELTFAIGRHALADLAFAFVRRHGNDELAAIAEERLTPEALAELRRRLEGSGLHAEGSQQSLERLEQLRRSYEPNAIAIAQQLALDLPGWLPGEDVRENWRIAVPEPGERRHLP
jgi:hypothetical protein